MSAYVSQDSGNNVGILAMDVYFPNDYVKQTDLETFYGVSQGKFTIGLGQETLAFTGDLEDINSMALTVVQSLLEKYAIDPNDVGRLEMGTESLIDKSKSTKTVLSTLFPGNTDLEGVTCVNACYGGTAALLNALAWVDSPSWDGRYAIVVAGDIAVYADGPARPTCGCGAVAMLIGRDAPVSVDLHTRTAHTAHVWDFFKPHMDSEYPHVNGAFSQICYLRALDDCYTRFLAKTKAASGESGEGVCVANTDHFLFHAPYNKLVQKSFGRCVYNDIRQGIASPEGTEKWVDVDIASTYEDKELETALKKRSAALYQEKVALSCELSRKTGNTYTASLYMNLANLISERGAELDGKQVVMYSYGSGAQASMFQVRPTSAAKHGGRFSLAAMQAALDLPARLSRRRLCTPDDLAQALKAREASHGCVLPFTPTYKPDQLLPGTFYLTGVSAIYERLYDRVPLSK